MAISTDPSVLAAASRCFDTCIPPGDQAAVKTYLLGQIAGVTDPAAVMTGARCFSSCISPGALPAVQAYQSAVLAGGSTDPSTLLNAARCFLSCIPPGANAAVTNYALANKAGGSTDPSTLANAARCFSSCIPPGMQMAAQSYLMAVASGGSTDPAVIIGNASGFIGTSPDGGSTGITDTGLVTWAGGGGPTPPPPVLTPLTDAWVAQVVANGGAQPSDSTITNMKTFETGITGQTYFSKIKEASLMVPDSAIAACTPFIRTKGAVLWTLAGAGPTGPGTTPALGFMAVGANGWRSDLCYQIGGATSNATPATIFSSDYNVGLTVYQCLFDNAHGPEGTQIGTFDSVNAFVSYALFGGNTGFACWSPGGADQMSQAWNGKYGYYSFNCSGAARRDIYFANSTNPHSDIDISVAAVLRNRATTALLANGWNNNGVASPSASNWYSFLCVNEAFTATESADLFTKIQAFRVALGTGFI